MSCCDWVLAELVRLHHAVSATEAQNIVENIVEKKSHLVQNFDGFLKTLNPKWGPKQRIVATLYHRNQNGATIIELTTWLKPSQRRNIHRTLRQLEHEEDSIVHLNDRFFITQKGIADAEKHQLIPSA